MHNKWNKKIYFYFISKLIYNLLVSRWLCAPKFSALGLICLGFVGVGVGLTLSPLYVFRGRLAKGRTKQGRNREKTEGTKGQSKGTRGAKGGSSLHRWQKLKKLQKIF